MPRLSGLHMTYDEWKAHNPADEEESPAEAERREHDENPCPPESGCEVCWPECKREERS